MSQYQGNSSSSHASIKYGELTVLGYNGRLPNADEFRKRPGHFALCQRSRANGLKPSTQHNDLGLQAAETICMRDQHSMSFSVTPTSTVVVEYVPDTNTDMFQIGRSTERPCIDFVVMDTAVRDDKSTISRFACRITCQRSPPYVTRIYAAGFDSKKNIFLGEKALTWKRPDGRMDGLTTNGVLVKHPLHGLTHDSKSNLWREISVCGNAFTQRENASAKRGEMVDADSQELVDGSLIDLWGVTLLWRTAEGLVHTPTIRNLDTLHKDLPLSRRQSPIMPTVTISPPSAIPFQQSTARSKQSVVCTEQGTIAPSNHLLSRRTTSVVPTDQGKLLAPSHQLPSRRTTSVVRTEQGTIAPSQQSTARSNQSVVRTEQGTIAPSQQSTARSNQSVVRTEQGTIAPSQQSTARSNQSVVRTEQGTIAPSQQSTARSNQSVVRTEQDTIAPSQQLPSRRTTSVVRTEKDTLLASSQQSTARTRVL